MDLPIYEITLGDWDMGIFATSLVKKPAHASDFIFMSKQDTVTWLFTDEEKHEVVGAVIVPDRLILRKDADGNEFNVKFSEEVIKELNQKMHDDGFNKYFTIAHELGAGDTVKFMESWIKETKEDKSVALGINEPIGTLFMKVKIDSDLVWENIKDGKLNGFSIELDASMIKTNLQKQGMDFTKLLKNEIVSGEDTLRFNTLALEEIVVRMEDGKEPEFYTGTFSNEGFEYVVKDGNITTITELSNDDDNNDNDDGAGVVNFKEAIVSLNKKVDDFIATITGLFEGLKPQDNTEIVSTISKLGDRFEELKLEINQNAASEDADNAAEHDESPAEFDVDSYRAASNWSKNKK